jgi:hypothetical protein
VLNATAAASVGAVGTYAWLRPADTTDYNAGATLAGSTLRYQGAPTLGGSVQTVDGGAPAGTWRAMGRRLQQANQYGYWGNDQWGATLWLRIS